MNRSSRCAAAAAVALLLSAAPAAAADQQPQNVGGTRSGWLTVLTGWFGDLIGDRGRDHHRLVAASDAPNPDGPPPQATAEPPADSETDGGPDWDPGS